MEVLVEEALARWGGGGVEGGVEVVLEEALARWGGGGVGRRVGWLLDEEALPRVVGWWLVAGCGGWPSARSTASL